jgi:hypothetical protein
LLADPVAGIERRFLHRQFATERARPAESTSERDDETGLTVSGFRTLVADHEHQELEHGQEHRRAAAEQRRRKVAELIDRHISDKS